MRTRPKPEHYDCWRQNAPPRSGGRAWQHAVRGQVGEPALDERTSSARTDAPSQGTVTDPLRIAAGLPSGSETPWEELAEIPRAADRCEREAPRWTDVVLHLLLEPPLADRADRSIGLPPGSAAAAGCATRLIRSAALAIRNGNPSIVIRPARRAIDRGERQIVSNHGRARPTRLVGGGRRLLQRTSDTLAGHLDPPRRQRQSDAPAAVRPEDHAAAPAARGGVAAARSRRCGATPRTAPPCSSARRGDSARRRCLAQWRRAWLERGAFVAWVTLDALDAPARFAEVVLASLRAASGRSSLNALEAEVGSIQPGREAEALTSLLAEIANFATLTVIVLDDADRLPAATLDEAVSYLLFNAPPNLRLVIGSRGALPLAVTDLQASGALTVVGVDDLRLSARRFRRDPQSQVRRSHHARRLRTPARTHRRLADRPADGGVDHRAGAPAWRCHRRAERPAWRPRALLSGVDCCRSCRMSWPTS